MNRPPRKQHFVVEPDQRGKTPFQYLRRVLPDASAGILRELLKRDCVTVDGKIALHTRPLQGGAWLEVDWPPELQDRVAKPRTTHAEIRELYLSPRILVVDKPAGVSVVAERRRDRDTLVDLLPESIAVDASSGVRVKVVHRIDKHTSGALLLARDREAKKALCQDFLERKIEKEYLAIVRGRFPDDIEQVDAPIATDRKHALKMVIDEKRGKASLTRFKVEKRFDGYTLVRAFPITGRTHQIRVHLAHVGFPILCDEVYGSAPLLMLSDLKFGYRKPRGFEERPLLKRLALHCASLGFTDPGTKEKVRVTAPLPHDLASVLKQLERCRPLRTRMRD